MVGDSSKPRSYRFTPDRLIAGLLPIEGLLWLSERFQWFPFNHHQGWTVLVAAATVVGAMCLLSLWWLAGLLLRWRFQLSVRSLLMLVVVIALPCSWLGAELQRARQRQRAVVGIENVGGGVRYASRTDAHGNWTEGQFPGSASAQPLTVFFFSTIIQADFNGTWLTDEQLEHVRGLDQLRWLFLANTHVTDKGLQLIGTLRHMDGLDLARTRVTDVGLKHLKGLAALRWISLDGTQVTDTGLKELQGLSGLESLGLHRTKVPRDGVRRLQQAFPHCKVEY